MSRVNLETARNILRRNGPGAAEQAAAHISVSNASAAEELSNAAVRAAVAHEHLAAAMGRIAKALEDANASDT